MKPETKGVIHNLLLDGCAIVAALVFRYFGVHFITAMLWIILAYASEASVLAAYARFATERN